MAEQNEELAEEAEAPAPRRRRTGRRIAGVLAILLATAGIVVWTSRERLADDIITGQLEKLGVTATYKIESIGPQQQILTDIVVGDPARPDLTIERVEVTLEPRFPFVQLGKVKVVRPRLFGSYRDGKLSFGALDKLLFEQDSKEPFSFPDLDLDLVDGRALLESDYGPVGVKAQGRGNLRGGFAGILAANAPILEAEGCTASKATLFGKISIDAERPGFSGPLRLSALDCPGNGAGLRDLAVELTTRVDRTLDGVEGEARLAGKSFALGENRLDGLDGASKFTWRKNSLTAQYDLGFGGVRTPQLALDSLALEGSARTRDGLSRVEVQANVEGTGLRPGQALDIALGDAAKSADGTLLGPMLTQIRSALAREGRDSDLSTEITLRKTGDMLSLVMPQARLRGSSGTILLALSRFQLAGSSEGGAPRFSGNFTTGGAGLPQINGRMESRGGRGAAELKMRMARYSAGGGSLELPDLTVVQESSGAVVFTGRALASGAIPGGSAQGLVVPFDGNWSPKQGLTLWRGCATIGFEHLALASLTLEGRTLQLCPPTGSAIVRSDGRGLRVAAGAPSLDLSGTMGATPLHLKSGAVGFAWPGTLVAHDVDVTMGGADAPTRFRLSQIDARIADEIAGSFSGTDAKLFAVPLDLLDASGNWRFANGRLDLTDGAFRLVDRQAPGRFEPLVARDATLSLVDNRVTANAVLREPKSDRSVAVADIVHDLSAGVGYADLDIPGIVFDQDMQPDTLTGLALGLVANANGTVTGKGRIDWTPETITSSGSFSTRDFDFAAAFGPVQGVSGTITFTDLLGMVTAPDQRLQIRSFNPGIEVESGELRYEIRDNHTMVINGGRWPFIGGALVLEPAMIRMAEPEERRFVLQLEGVDAAQFVERMALANISATGTFDGRVPLVFDENGGRIEGGALSSRPPGGNVSYVGKLTYEDMNPFANYAFEALKSLDYRQMEIALEGSLTGEIVTRVRFDGIRQGDGTSKNIVTRQIAKLPIRFNVNIHAPFYQLIGSFKSMYDPALARDPRDLGLIDGNGMIIENPTLKPPVPEATDLPDDESGIQPPESEQVP
ncbi:MAG TPA: YdbH domain-containing protein [Sphingomonadaceae bacterium]|nr:YdbH domain-containing protein [Sphingomonadaceae bacterium]